jgi:hypothetical protein
VNHYISIGFDHFYLINDNSGDYSDFINKYENKYFTIYDNNIDINCENFENIRDNNNCDRNQIIVQEYFKMIKNAEETEWIMIIQLDELLYSNNSSICLKETLSKYSNEYSQIIIYQNPLSFKSIVRTNQVISIRSPITTLKAEIFIDNWNILYV